MNLGKEKIFDEDCDGGDDENDDDDDVDVDVDDDDDGVDTDWATDVRVKADGLVGGTRANVIRVVRSTWRARRITFPAMDCLVMMPCWETVLGKCSAVGVNGLERFLQVCIAPGGDVSTNVSWLIATRRCLRLVAVVLLSLLSSTLLSFLSLMRIAMTRMTKPNPCRAMP